MSITRGRAADGSRPAYGIGRLACSTGSREVLRRAHPGISISPLHTALRGTQLTCRIEKTRRGYRPALPALSGAMFLFVYSHPALLALQEDPGLGHPAARAAVTPYSRV